MEKRLISLRWYRIFLFHNNTGLSPLENPWIHSNLKSTNGGGWVLLSNLESFLKEDTKVKSIFYNG